MAVAIRSRTYSGLGLALLIAMLVGWTSYRIHGNLTDAAGWVTLTLIAAATWAVHRDNTRRWQTEAALTRRSAELDVVLDSATEVALIATDPNGLITLFNSGAERMLGYAAAEMLGRQTLAVIHAPEEIAQRGRDVSAELGRHIEGFDALVEHARQSGHEVREWTYVRRDGAPLTVNLAVTAVRGAGGAITGFLAIATDVTKRNLAERHLREAERFRQSILDALGAQVAILDGFGTIIAVNAPWRQFADANGFLGGAYGLGTNYIAVCEAASGACAEEAAAVARGIRDMLAGRRATFYQEYPCHGPGEPRWFAVRVTSFKFGHQTRGVVTHENITARRQAQDQLRTAEEWLELALESSHTGLWDWDLRSNHTHYSSIWKRQLGYADDELSGSSEEWLELVHPDDREHLAASVIAYLGNPRATYETEFRVRHKDGTYRSMFSRAAVQLDADGAPVRMLGAHVDITEAKRAEATLRQAKEAAEQANRVKSHFLATVSHEIRTPMNGVIGMTGLLLDTALATEQREYAETIRASAEALLAIINDILDFSKIEAGKLNLDTVDFDVRQVAEEVVELLAEPAQRKGLELASLVYRDVPTALRGDPGRLRQILINLIGNAIKFTEHGEIVLRVKQAELSDDAVVLRCEVSDTGIGIRRERRDHLFDAFAQGDSSTTRRYGGTGLGLAVSKRLTQLMDGHIGVDSEPGKGSTFWFTARLARQPARDLAAPPVPPCELHGRRLLVVDDNATNRAIVHHQVVSWGMLCDRSADAADALVQLRNGVQRGQPYDVAVLDMQMPGTDGLGLAQAITADATLCATRLILLTSLGQPSDRSATRAAGIRACLTKPVRQSELYDCLVSVIGAAAAAGAPPRESPAVAVKLVLARSGARARVLIAEDNAVNQKVTAHLLDKLGYRADIVANGLEAIEAMGRILYDAVLMDCRMPEMDGFEATARIRTLERRHGRHTPIIAMTANAMQGDREQCLAAGMDDYLSKPLKTADLAAMLHQWIPCSDAPPEPARLDDAIDRTELLQRLDSDTTLIETVSQLFLADYPQLFAKIRNAVERQDAAALMLAAHTLKGAAANLAAKHVVETAAEMERMGRSGDLARAAETQQVLESELARLQAALLALPQGSAV